jgi:hypothetical protein
MYVVLEYHSVSVAWNKPVSNGLTLSSKPLLGDARYVIVKLIVNMNPKNCGNYYLSNEFTLVPWTTFLRSKQENHREVCELCTGKELHQGSVFVGP